MDNSPLNKLPPELRDHIYNLVLTPEPKIYFQIQEVSAGADERGKNPGSGTSQKANRRWQISKGIYREPGGDVSKPNDGHPFLLAPTMVCRQMRRESRSMILGLTNFCFHVQPQCGRSDEAADPLDDIYPAISAWYHIFGPSAPLLRKFTLMIKHKSYWSPAVLASHVIARINQSRKAFDLSQVELTISIDNWCPASGDELNERRLVDYPLYDVEAARANVRSVTTRHTQREVSGDGDAAWPESHYRAVRHAAERNSEGLEQILAHVEALATL